VLRSLLQEEDGEMLGRIWSSRSFGVQVLRRWWPSWRRAAAFSSSSSGLSVPSLWPFSLWWWWRICLRCPGWFPGRYSGTGPQLPSVGTGTFAVLKAYDGDGLCRWLDAWRSSSLCAGSGEAEDGHGGGVGVVEDGALCNQTPRRTSLYFSFFLGLFVQMCCHSCTGSFRCCVCVSVRAGFNLKSTCTFSKKKSNRNSWLG
jgi:hypothetical protein